VGMCWRAGDWSDALALQVHAWPWTDLPTAIARWGGGAGRACLRRGSSAQGGQRQRSYILPRCAGDTGGSDAVQEAGRGRDTRCTLRHAPDAKPALSASSRQTGRDAEQNRRGVVQD
jgi:hypothetical protein